MFLVSSNHVSLFSRWCSKRPRWSSYRRCIKWWTPLNRQYCGHWMLILNQRTNQAFCYFGFFVLCEMQFTVKKWNRLSGHRIVSKVFRTRSAVVVAECQRNFHFLPFKHQLFIRTAKFLQRFIAPKNIPCSLFSLKATSQLNSLYSVHGYKVGFTTRKCNT